MHFIGTSLFKRRKSEACASLYIATNIYETFLNNFFILLFLDLCGSEIVEETWKYMITSSKRFSAFKRRIVLSLRFHLYDLHDYFSHSQPICLCILLFCCCCCCYRV